MHFTLQHPFLFVFNWILSRGFHYFLMAGDLKGWWRQERAEFALQERESTTASFFIPSPVEGKDTKDREAVKLIAEEKRARAKACTDEGMKEGLKAAFVACLATAIPTLTAVRMVPWVKANVNYTGQALIISGATIATYFVVAEQTILECSRKQNATNLEKSRAGLS